MQAAAWAASVEPRGEYTVVLDSCIASDQQAGARARAPLTQSDDDQDAAPDGATSVTDVDEGLALIDMLVATGIRQPDAVKRVAVATGVPRSQLYTACLLRKQ
jgi:hypothetical protein